MNILQLFKNITLFIFFQVLVFMPAFSLDLDSTVNDVNRSTYTKDKIESAPVQQQVKEQSKKTMDLNQEQKILNSIEKPKLPNVPALPQNINSPTVAPFNGVYSGKVPNEDAITPCNFKVERLVIDESVVKSKYKSKDSTIASKQAKTKQQSSVSSKTNTIPKGTQFRVVNKTQIADSLPEGRLIEFVSTQELSFPYIKIPKNTKFTAKVIDSHKPQISCNGGLVALKFVSVNLKGQNQPINAGIIKIKTENVYFGNLKGEHTYWKTTCKKAKWGQKMFTKWSKTSAKLATKGACVIVAPFPYIGGCVLAVSSTVSSPITALLGKGERLIIPANTTFTIKLYEDAKIK